MNNIIKQGKMICIISTLFLAGCYQNGYPSTSSTGETPNLPALPTQTNMVPTPILNIQLTEDPHLTATVNTSDYTIITETVTPSPVLTPTAPPEANLQFQCLDQTATMPTGLRASGIIALGKSINDPRSRQVTYLLDMSTGNGIQIDMPGEHQIYHTLSLDRKLLAYESVFIDDENRVTKEGIVIINAEGQQLKTFPWEKEWFRFSGWLSDQRLVIELPDLDPRENSLKLASTFLVIDPNTGMRQVLRPDFPDIYNYSPGTAYWEPWEITMYDPFLTRVVYPLLTGKGKGYEFTYGIWDFPSRKLLASLESVFTNTSDYFPIPRWSPDGSRFVVEGVDFPHRSLELFLVSRDGEVEQLTSLYRYQKAKIENYTWSPDGRYIAGWLDTNWDLDNDEELTIIDTRTKQIVDYCLRVTYVGEGYGGGSLPIPIWSPEGQQLIVMDWYEKEHRRVILVDLEKGIAAQIAEDMEPVGWMVAP